MGCINIHIFLTTFLYMQDSKGPSSTEFEWVYEDDLEMEKCGLPISENEKRDSSNYDDDDFTLVPGNLSDYMGYLGWEAGIKKEEPKSLNEVIERFGIDIGLTGFERGTI